MVLVTEESTRIQRDLNVNITVILVVRCKAHVIKKKVNKTMDLFFVPSTPRADIARVRACFSSELAK